MRWMTIVLLLSWGCQPRLDDCDDDTDCAVDRVCASGYCLPRDARPVDAAIDQSLPDAQPTDAQSVDADLVDADLVDAVVADAQSSDAGPDGQAPDAEPDASTACEEGTVQPCEPVVGVCDPGQQTCRDGAWSACEGVLVREEACDGGDTDCDGTVDEGFGVGEACTAGLGVCAEGGVIVCAEGVAACDAARVEPAGPEVCTRAGDPVDEDCDGRLDEAAGDRISATAEALFVGISRARIGEIAGASDLDIAVTTNHTALLVNTALDHAEVQVFSHVADGTFGLGMDVELPRGLLQLQVATRGEDLVVAGLLPPEDEGQPVYLAVVPVDGSPMQGEVVWFAGQADGLKVVDSPADRTILFVHAVGAPDVQMRVLIDGRNPVNRPLPTPGISGAWAAASDGEVPYLLWRTPNGLQYREFRVNEGVRWAIADPLTDGEPSIVLTDEPSVFSVDDEGALTVARIVDNEPIPGPRLTGLSPVAVNVAPDLDEHTIFAGQDAVSADERTGGVVALQVPDLRRARGGIVRLLGIQGPPVVATRAGRGATAWIDTDGRVMLQPLWSGCASIQPRPAPEE